MVSTSNLTKNQLNTLRAAMSSKPKISKQRGIATYKDYLMDFSSVGFDFRFEPEESNIGNNSNNVGIKLDKDSYTYLYDYLKRIKSQFHDRANSTLSGNSENEIQMYLTGTGTSALLNLKSRNNEYYMNAVGNPISFLTNQNTVGSVNVAVMVRRFLRGILHTIKRYEHSFRTPQILKDKISSLDIHIHKLAFACYTDVINVGAKENRKSLIASLLSYMESIYTATIEDSAYNTLKDHIGVKVFKDSAHSLRLEKYIGTNRYYSLVIYDKNIQLRSLGRLMSEVAEGRLRFDLTLTNYYLSNNKLNTVAEIHHRYGGDYKSWVKGLFQKVLSELKIPYIFDFVIPENSEIIHRWKNSKKLSPKLRAELKSLGLDYTIPYDIHAFICAARSLFSLKKEWLRDAISGDSLAKESLANQFISGLSNPGYQLVSRFGTKMIPRFNHTDYSISSRGIVIDNNTGEVLSKPCCA